MFLKNRSFIYWRKSNTSHQDQYLVLKMYMEGAKINREDTSLHLNCFVYCEKKTTRKAVTKTTKAVFSSLNNCDVTKVLSVETQIIHKSASTVQTDQHSDLPSLASFQQIHTPRCCILQPELLKIRWRSVAFSVSAQESY